MLTDQFYRTIRYLRLSVTDRCNLRCIYCLPKRWKDFKAPKNWLTFDEIERLVAIFVGLGVEHVRLTGGEPLLRAGLPGLASRLSALPGLNDLSLTTNATQLSHQAQLIYNAGVKRLNISIDSLRSECMHALTGSDSLPAVMKGIMQAKSVGFSPIKLNMVVLSGVNDQDIEPMVDFCLKEGFVLRLIEAMPVGETGRLVPFMGLDRILRRLHQRYGLQPVATEIGGGPARYWGTPDGQLTLGLITPITQHFCATCNRIRLSVDGILYTCLGQNSALPLLPLLRQGGDDAAIIAAIRGAVRDKPKRHEFKEKPTQIMRFMSALGG